MKTISPYISYKEATASATAARLGIDNTPNAQQLSNMRLLASNVFTPLRTAMGRPLTVNSFFRSKRLNRAIGGSPTSQHCTGEAIDIDGSDSGVSNKKIFDYIREHLPFDQLIWEYGTDSQPLWVHVSYSSAGRNRRQVLRAYKHNGKTIYKQLK